MMQGDRITDGRMEPIVLNSVSTVVDNYSRYLALKREELILKKQLNDRTKLAFGKGKKEQHFIDDKLFCSTQKSLAGLRT